MAYYTLFDLSKDVDSNLHAGGVSTLQNFFETVDKGRRAMIGRVRPEELVRMNYLEQSLYPNVDRYALPDDVKYKDLLELKLLSGYRNVDNISQPLQLVYRRRFDQKRNGAQNVINIGYENGIKYCRIMNPAGIGCGPYVVGDSGDFIQGTQFIPINDCDSLSLNGSWNVGGNVVNLRLDELEHVIGHASLKFDINNSDTQGYIENFTLNPFNLFTMLQRGATFAWLDLPLPQQMLSVKLTMGSDTSDLTNNIYYATVNHPHDNNQFTTGWNLLKYMLNELATVGTPNPKALNFIRFDFTTTGVAIPNCHLDNIVARRGRVYEIVYNSSYCILDGTTKAWKKVATSNDDIIVAEEDTYNILLWETTLAAQKEIYGSGAGAKSDINDIDATLNGVRSTRGILIKQGMYDIYLMEHPSEALLDMDSSHIFGNQYDGLSDDPLPGYGGGVYGQG